jgi:hypothetical protein
MRNIRRIMLGSLVGALGVLAFATSAQAAGVTQAAAGCAITGHANADVQWLDGAQGTYGFTSLTIACAGQYVTNDTARYGACSLPTSPNCASPVVATLNVNSNGKFTNIACGTGTAGDAAPVQAVLPGAIDPGGRGSAILADVDLGYQIDFAAGKGAFVWSAGGDPGSPQNVSPNASAGRRVAAPNKLIPLGGGAININPDSSFPVTTTPTVPGALCTHGFDVQGAVGATVASTS